MEKIKGVWDDKSSKDHKFIDARSRTESIDPNCSWGISDKDIVGDLVSGLPWPPRCYTCTFCKREFRSAQALGGHMNVHRRDRARLRQMTSCQSFSPSFTSLIKQNPNFSPHFCSKMSPSTTMLSPLTLSSSTSRPSYHLCRKGEENVTMMKSHLPGFGYCKFHGFPRENEGKIAVNSESVRWNLESESKSDALDLELRLGCS
ncbi:hypothetical protein L1987_69350 [Smallanthus sonchifolius]|uniref:Uncharacterized protein n=1 Tax=Smallanthus sonchifolius TaxID=185202 RepID=A0ACB9B7Q2_9ASTR|nr:hypothetical protein L1987_69350 [Smallanthus sonchifolius]